MRKEEDKPSDCPGVQVFELTMDNPEDQDELNRRLRKPGEPGPAGQVAHRAIGESTVPAAGKKPGAS